MLSTIFDQECRRFRPRSFNPTARPGRSQREEKICSLPLDKSRPVVCSAQGNKLQDTEVIIPSAALTKDFRNYFRMVTEKKGEKEVVRFPERKQKKLSK